jgi:hypothetical protein
MRRNAERHAADYVVICPAWAFGPDRPPSFAQELLKRREVDWLKPIALKAGPLEVWEMVDD